MEDEKGWEYSWTPSLASLDCPRKSRQCQCSDRPPKGKFETRLCCAILFCLELKSLFEQPGRVLLTQSIGLMETSSCSNWRMLHVELSKNFPSVWICFWERIVREASCSKRSSDLHSTCLLPAVSRLKKGSWFLCLELRDGRLGLWGFAHQAS